MRWDTTSRRRGGSLLLNSINLVSYIFIILKHIQVTSQFRKLLMLKVRLSFLGDNLYIASRIFDQLCLFNQGRGPRGNLMTFCPWAMTDCLWQDYTCILREKKKEIKYQLTEYCQIWFDFCVRFWRKPMYWRRTSADAMGYIMIRSIALDDPPYFVIRETMQSYESNMVFLGFLLHFHRVNVTVNVSGSLSFLYSQIPLSIPGVP